MAIKQVKIIEMKLPNFSIGEDENNNLYRFKGGVLGQTVLIKSGKKKAGYISGKIIEIVKKSDLETLESGYDLNEMAGNKFENIPYEEEIKIKSEIINKLYKEINWNKDIKLNLSPIVKEYRNKMEYTFGDEYKDGPLILGMHKTGKFYEIAEHSGGSIANEDFDKIRSFTQDYFRERGLKHHHKTRHTGELKFFVIRYSFYENELMINLVTNSSEKITDELLKDYAQKIFNINLKGKITSFYHTISDSISDAIKPDKIIKIAGKDYLTEKINGLLFRISPFSFFQPNPKGAENLYNKALEFAGNIENKKVYDLYSGTGTISQIFAKKANKVIGVEIVEEAVEKARENSKLNNLNNTEFIAEDVLMELDKLREKQELEGSPDIIVVDPPRAGIHSDAIKKIISTKANTIVYISCNPVTQVEDLKIFIEEGYRIEKIEAFDQFPRTMNVETVALLSKLDVDKHINIEIELDELDLTSAESKATYAQIKEYVWNKFELKVSTLYIAQIKKKCGIELREHYNKSKKEKQIIPQCTPEKEEAIMDALRHFKMI